MAGDSSLDTSEDREIFSLIFGSLRHPRRIFAREPSLSIVLQALLPICVVSGLLYPLGRVFTTGSITSGMSVVFALSIVQLCLIIPALVLIEAAALFIPLKLLKNMKFGEVLKSVGVSMSTAPLTVLLVVLPQPIPAAALISLIYMLYIQINGLRHYM